MNNYGFRNIQKKLNLTNAGVSETLGVELFTVRQWASGIWEIPRPIAKFLHTLLQMKRLKESTADSEYRKGYINGYSEGYGAAMEAMVQPWNR